MRSCAVGRSPSRTSWPDASLETPSNSSVTTSLVLCVTRLGPTVARARSGPEFLRVKPALLIGDVLQLKDRFRIRSRASLPI